MLYAIAMMLLLLIFPTEAAIGVQNGLRLCAQSVIPALFPFLVASRLLTAAPLPCKRLANYFCMNENVLNALIVSYLGGYPIGVVTLCSMYDDGKLKKHEAEQAIRFCNNSGPGFFIGMIGGAVFNNTATGLILYIIHVISSIICIGGKAGYKNTYTIKRRQPPNKSFSRQFTQAVTSSVTAMFHICALVILFSVFNHIINSIEILSQLPFYVRAAFSGMLELTSGITLLKKSGFAFMLCAFLMGWGGLCVHMQASAAWEKSGLKVKGYYTHKLLHGIISALFSLLWLQSKAVFLLCAVFSIIICIISPKIHQKWGRKKKKVIV